MAYLAAVAEKAGHEVRIVDAGRGESWDLVEHSLEDFRPDLVGLGATSQTYQSAEKAVFMAKKRLPDSVCILGGTHPTAMPEHAYKSFYMRPSYLFRKLLSMRSLTQLRGHIRGFFSMADVS